MANTEWKEVSRIPVDATKNRIRIDDAPRGKHVLVVEEQVETDIDITDQIKAKLVRSGHNDGYYCSLEYNGTSIAALGINEASKCHLNKGYHMHKAKGASVSFRITRDRRE